MIETIAAIVGTISIVEIIHLLYRNYFKPRISINKIHAGYSFIEKGVITRGKGGLYQFEDDNDSEEAYKIGAFNAASGIDFINKKNDKSDFLIFSIENSNNFLIDSLAANIGIYHMYYSPGEPIFNLNCSWDLDGDYIHIKINELFPEQKAYLIIPLLPPRIKVTFNNPEEEKRFWNNKKICDIDVWYDTLSLKITRSKVLRKTTNALAILQKN